MSARLDPHGQPVARFNRSRLTDRAIDELVGLCKGVLADGVVDENEAKFLANWMQANREARDRWPANVLFPRIREMLEDDVLDADEQAELLDLIIDATGGGLAPTPEDGSMSTALPVCAPAPEIEFEGFTFCMTGKFASGTRKECQAQVVALGGSCKGAPSRAVDYLVIGTIGSTDWIHSTHGRKIERAVQLREEGSGIHIVAEEHWFAAVKGAAQ